MFVDSHCHISDPEFTGRIPDVLARMQENQVSHALCVSVDLSNVPEAIALAQAHPNIYASVGVHPEYADVQEPTTEELIALAQPAKVVAIGETGLDYFHTNEDEQDKSYQHERFRRHIQASRATKKPLIIHTRSAGDDTLRILKEEGAAIDQGGVAGVIHCFTETREFAQAAMEMGFYISLSGIVTFKSAKDLQAIAKDLPLDRLLIETDSPYLAPVPYRGKTNEPGFVKYVGEFIADLKGIPVSELAKATTDNFFKLFNIPANQR